MYPLKLSVNPEGGRIFRRRKSDARFAAFSKNIFHRDHFSCQFCGKESRAHQEVVNIDQNYFHNKASNLVTSCGFCAQCFFLESVGVGGYGGGTLIYLPEIAQNYLNAVCHVLFAAMDHASDHTEIAHNIYRHLKLRSKVIETEWGENMQEPALFGQLLIESGDRSLLSKNIFLSVRLLPSRAAFKQERDLDAMVPLASLPS